MELFLDRAHNCMICQQHAVHVGEHQAWPATIPAISSTSFWVSPLWF